MDRLPNHPGFRGLQKDWMLYAGLPLTGLIYGGLHCAAWNAPFPTNIEVILWRVSSVMISSTFILLLLLYLCELYSPDRLVK